MFTFLEGQPRLEYSPKKVRTSCNIFQTHFAPNTPPHPKKKDKIIRKANKLKSIQERNNTRKTLHNGHDPEYEVKVVDKSKSGKLYSRSLTYVIAKGVLFS